MGFENVQIQLAVGPSTYQNVWRQDASAGSVVSVRLNSSVGINTYHWLLRRPEGSVAGGAGIEPISLGTSSAASFVVDLQGTYIVWCYINAGAPNEELIRGGVAFLQAETTGDGKALRLLGPGETNEDQADPTIQQGWIKMLNRWLKYIAGAGVTDVHDVKADAADPAPAFLDTKLVAGSNISLTPVTIAGVHKIQIASTESEVHNDLSGRDHDVAIGEDGCHPADAIGPGRLHTPFGVATIVAGLLMMPAAKTASNEVLVIGDGPLQGIATAGWEPGDRIGITFLGAPHVVTGASVSTGYAALSLQTKSGSEQDIRFDSVHGEPPRTNGRIGLQLRTDANAPHVPCWQLIRGPYS